ncbi:MAG: M28 family peptidase [Elusimicrobiota bacterium]
MGRQRQVKRSLTRSRRLLQAKIKVYNHTIVSNQTIHALAAIFIVNLGLFVLVTWLPNFQAAHHHWIFPLLAALLALQWAATFALAAFDKKADLPAARAFLASLLLFLLVMGIVRHATILACFDQCAFKLAAAAAIAAPVFWAQGLLDGAGWWSRRRSSLAALGSAAWALYLAMRGFQLGWWVINMSFAVVALLCWLGRSRAEFLLLSIGIGAGILIQQSASESVRIGLGVTWGVLIPLICVERVQAALASNPRRNPSSPAPGIARVAATAVVLAGILFYIIGPVFLMTDRAQRRARLETFSPEFPLHDPKALSPLAARLRGHVVALAQTIGERGADRPDKQAQSTDYIVAQFKRAGYTPKKLAYASRWMPSVKNGTKFENVEAVLAVAPADSHDAWIIGAHYDSASGTPGADDNASGVAVLLETARLLKAKNPGRDVRFVAFGTEEPPSFGTQNMGSAHYARFLMDNGVKVHAMISLEMLGYYNARRGSQFYPPFMHLFYPSHGDYVSVVGNFKSRRLLMDFSRTWSAASDFPLKAAILPGVFSGLALSDQLNFWDLGYPALMLSDTAFYRNPHYHQHTDVPDTLDYEKMARVVLGLVDVLGQDPTR